MTIRRATIEHLTPLIFLQYNLAMEEYNEIPPKLVDGITTILNAKTAEHGFYLIAEDEENYVGCLRASFKFSDWRNAKNLYIDGVIIAQEFRRRGHLMRLLDACKKIAIAEGCDKLTLFVEDTNMKAQAAYLKYGFKAGKEWQYDL